MEGWEQIRALDEVENWAERTRVVSKKDHQYYTECAHVSFGSVLPQGIGSDMHPALFSTGIHS